MPSFEEEAFSRAQQMHRRTPYYREQAQKRDAPPAEKAEPAQQENKSENKFENKENQKNSGTNQNRQGLLDIMFQNKEQSLILLLIVLLMEENTEPSLLLALMYLLI